MQPALLLSWVYTSIMLNRNNIRHAAMLVPELIKRAKLKQNKDKDKKDGIHRRNASK